MVVNKINGDFMIKNHFKIVLIILMGFMHLSSNVFPSDLNEEEERVKAITNLAQGGDVQAQ